MESQLNKIAKYYKKEYNLNTNIDIVKIGCNTYFNYISNYIYFAIDYIKKDFAVNKPEKRSGYKNLKYNLFFVLLHEIYHAIDYKNNRNRWKREIKNIDTMLYFSDLIYHNSHPFEQRADEFARKELKKWINKL
jgi:hypothetical protein